VTPRATLVGVILACIAAGALVGDLLSPVDAAHQHLDARLRAPFTYGPDGIFHLLGTDHLGRDMLARTMVGARVSLMVALGGVLIAGLTGISVGLLAGFCGGRIDALIMMSADAQLALPFTLLAISIAVISGPSVANVLVVLGATGWVTYARLLRAEVLALQHRDFVVAARSLGCAPERIVLRHILPHCISSIIVVSSFMVAQLIVAEATVSFLGVGIPSWVPSWGTMIAEGRSYLAVASWVPLIPGLAVTITVVAINLLGDYVRDRLDPRTRVI
jgi:peptide/nickel transport system permease protein